MCHGCGGCTLICPEKAITEKPREIGMIEKGMAGSMAFMQGILNVGDPMATPIIRQLHNCLDLTKTVILDSPPGTSCPVIETVRGSDFCILVTEPTPFGLHDLRLAVDTVRQLKVPFGVIINSAGIGDDAVEDYCREEGIRLLMKIAWDRRIAEGYSRGEPVVRVMPELKEQFKNLYAEIANAA
jgi:MinD superfamily P-loop ATPase